MLHSDRRYDHRSKYFYDDLNDKPGRSRNGETRHDYGHNFDKYTYLQSKRRHDNPRGRKSCQSKA